MALSPKGDLRLRCGLMLWPIGMAPKPYCSCMSSRWWLLQNICEWVKNLFSSENCYYPLPLTDLESVLVCYSVPLVLHISIFNEVSKVIVTCSCRNCHGWLNQTASYGGDGLIIVTRCIPFMSLFRKLILKLILS